MKEIVTLLICIAALIGFAYSGKNDIDSRDNIFSSYKAMTKQFLGIDVISRVKKGIIPGFDKGISVGQAIDNYKYLSNVRWKAAKGDSGRLLISAEGVIDQWRIQG